jgi:DedD protein
VAPHRAAPAADAPASSDAPGGAAIPAAPGAAADTAADAVPAPATAPRPGAPAAPASEHGAHGKKHAAAEAAAPGKLFVQAGAMARESMARELASRIAKSGLTPFVERTATSDGVRYRVRLGPYATRTDAERSRARLRALGVDANIVGA